MTPDERAALSQALQAGGHGALVEAFLELKAFVHDELAGHSRQVAEVEQGVAAAEAVTAALEAPQAPPSETPQ